MTIHILLCLSMFLTCATEITAAEDSPVVPVPVDEVTVPSEMSQEKAIGDANLAPVYFHGGELFQVGSVLDLDPNQRAEELEMRLQEIADSHRIRTDSLVIRSDERMGVSLILAGNEAVSATWEQEAALLGKPRMEIAEERLAIIVEAINAYRADYSFGSIVKGVIFTAIATLVLILLLYLVAWVRRREEAFVERRFGDKRIGKVSIGGDILAIHQIGMRIIRIVIYLWLLTAYTNLVLSLFPWTYGLAHSLFEFILNPLKTFGQAFVNEIPSLFTIAVIVVLTRFTLRIIKRLFTHIEEGTIKFKGFYPDWSGTTYQLVYMFVLVAALVAAFPYIPGSNSPAFKGISLFLGLLVSLGSSSAIANLIAGLILTYMRPFVAGDYVQVSQTFGVIMRRRILSTRIQTTKNEMVSIPNSTILNGHIVNYSYNAQKKGLRLYTAVTIGYDVPWRTVHDLLIRAGQMTDDVLDKPEPFVLQTSLDDFYVTYELNVTTKLPFRRPQIYSQLHQNIQDVFAEAGVEIMSPHYRQNREGNETTIPPAGSGKTE